MSLSGAIRLAARMLSRNRLRSVLTLLGITIGVAVVVVMVAIGNGARQAVSQQVQAAGAHLIEVSAGNYSQGDQDPSSGDVAEPGNLAGGASTSDAPVARAARTRAMTGDQGWAGMGVSPRLPGRGAATTLGTPDIATLTREVDGLRFTAATVTDTAVVFADDARRRVFARLRGTDVAAADMRALTAVHGRFFTAREVTARAAVVVLAADTALTLFPSAGAAVGQQVLIRRAAHTVVGVVRRAAGAEAESRALPDVYVPFTRAQDLLQITHLHGISLSVTHAGDATRVARDLTRVLRVAHGLGPDDPDDFTVRTQARTAVLGKGVNPLLARAVAGGVANLDDVTFAEMTVSLERAGRTMTALLASVASVSLLVGGIGIMNVMLVSVTERTREIGLRMAVGARSRDVLVQFLAEAVTLSTAGGVVGIVLGIAAAVGLGRLLRWTTVVSPESVVLAVGAATCVGVCFGFYPARQASRLEPIDALRFE